MCVMSILDHPCNQMTIEAVKEKLWKKCGTSVDSMSLELYDETGAKVSDLAHNTRPLGFYSPHDGFLLFSLASSFPFHSFVLMVISTFLTNLL